MRSEARFKTRAAGLAAEALPSRPALAPRIGRWLGALRQALLTAVDRLTESDLVMLVERASAMQRARALRAHNGLPRMLQQVVVRQPPGLGSDT